MNEPVIDAHAHEGEGGGQPDTRLTRIRLWTRTSYTQDPVAIDEAPATGRIAELSSIVARSRSPPTYLPSITRNGAQETNLTHGQPTRTGARSNDRFERNRALSAKYGLDLTESEFPVPVNQTVQRVERSIRMRIRFWCHHCNTQYTSGRVCPQCSHQRCNRCARHPPRRTAPRVRLADAARLSNALSAENLHAHSIAEATSNSPYISIPVISQAYTNGHHHSVPRPQAPAVSTQQHLQNGTEQEHLNPPQSRILRQNLVRVRHICHECQGPILSGESTCSGCGHERCKDCLRHPSPRGQPVTSSSSRNLDHSTLSLASESVGGGDEFENETIPEDPTSTIQGARAAPTIASLICLSTSAESINAGDVDVAPPEPPPPPV